MFMTASRIKIDGKPVLKLNIHECDKDDIAFLETLGINQRHSDSSNLRFTHIHSQEIFRSTRSAILEKYEVLEEKGPRVLLERKVDG